MLVSDVLFQDVKATDTAVVHTDTLTMSSSQFAALLGKDKKHINEAIKKMFQPQIDGRTIRPSLDTRGYVIEYHLPQVEANMFVAKHDITHLRTVSEYFVHGKAEPVKPMTQFEMIASMASGMAEVENRMTSVEDGLKFLDSKIDGFKVADVIPSNMSSTTQLQTLCDYYFSKDALTKIFKHNLQEKMYDVESEHGINAAYYWNTSIAIALLVQISDEAVPVKEGSEYYRHTLVPQGKFLMKLKSSI